MEATPATCPRRMTEIGPWAYTGELDGWKTWPGPAGQLGPACSFCGSLDPGAFLEMVRDGWIVGPTDKNYKVYVQRAPTDTELAARRTRWVARDPVAKTIREHADRHGIEPQETAADLDRAWAESGEGRRGVDPQGKFYFQHLSAAQRVEYLDLHNTGRIVYGPPGHLYVLPYFCVTGG